MKLGGIIRMITGRSGNKTIKSSEEYLKVLVENGIYILAKHFERAGDKSKKVEFMDYNEDGVNIFPVFSSPQKASEFISKSGTKQIFTCACLQLSAVWLTENNLTGSKLMIDPRTSSEREITQEDLEKLRDLLKD